MVGTDYDVISVCLPVYLSVSLFYKPIIIIIIIIIMPHLPLSLIEVRKRTSIDLVETSGNI